MTTQETPLVVSRLTKRFGQKKALKGAEPITARPGSLLKPADLATVLLPNAAVARSVVVELPAEGLLIEAFRPAQVGDDELDVVDLVMNVTLAGHLALLVRCRGAAGRGAPPPRA